MTKRRKNHTDIPTLRLHKASGRGRVRLNGQDCYVGQYGTVEAEEAYNRLIAQWLMSGRCLPSQPKRSPGHTTTDISDGDGEVLTVRELVERYLVWARLRYAKSNHARVNNDGIKPMVEAFGSTPAVDFGPNSLRIVRQLMIQRGWVRTNINHHISTVRSVFGWGVSHELLPESVHAALKLVEPIRFGAEGVKESPKKELIPEGTIELLRPFLSGQVFSIIRLMWLAGARCGELCQLRPMDLNKVEVDGIEIVEYTPGHHKTAHKGFDRIIRLGPQAAMVLRPFLNRPDDSFCFSPREAEVERHKKMHEARITPPSYGNNIGTNCKPKPQRRPGNQYSTIAVRTAVWRAIAAYNKACADDADFDLIKQFSPHQLRHTSLTRMRNQFGIEATMSMAGHHSLSMTELYSSRSTAARKVAAQAG